MITSIYAQCNGRPDGHYALKYTAIVTLDIMTRWNKAQDTYLNDILKFNKKEFLSREDLKENLVEMGITFSDDEFQYLFNSLQFDDNHSD